MFSSFLFGGSSSTSDQDELFDIRRCSQISEALYRARIEASTAKAILYDNNMTEMSVQDISNLIARLSQSTAESATDSQHNRELWRELPTYIRTLAQYPPTTKLSSLPSRDASRIAANVTRAASLVKEMTEKHQAALKVSLDNITRGRFKAATTVDSESKRGQKIHTLLLPNLMFDDSALNAFRRTLQDKQIVVLDLSNCFLGDHVVQGLLMHQLRDLSQLSVLSLRGNALTNEIVPYLITPTSPDESATSSATATASSNTRALTAGDVMDSLTCDSTTNVTRRGATASTTRTASNNNSGRHHHHHNNHNTSNTNNFPALLESANHFMALRLLILDDNEISTHHLTCIKVTLARRWQRTVVQYDSGVASGMNSFDSTSSSSRMSTDEDDSSSSRLNFHLHPGDINNHHTTTQMAFRSPLPSIFLSLDGSGMAGITQAQYLANNPELNSQLPECIVATSASVITACAIALTNIPMATVCKTFKRLAEEVFQRSEWNAQHYAESAAMWVRQWWTCGDYYSSGKAFQILQDLFGNQKFVDFPGSRVIVVLETAKGQILLSSSQPTSPALQTQCHTFSSKPAAVVQQCPTVAEVCLAAMAGPGYFAPRPLNIPSTRISSSSSSTQSQAYDPTSAATALVEQIAVFDACGSTPNPSHIALIESMRPTTKQRRLISIACESESEVSSITDNGIASIAASALSNWPSARVGVGKSELHGDFSIRNAAFEKLLKNRGYIARAASISVEHVAESTEDNEVALEEWMKMNVVTSSGQQQQQETSSGGVNGSNNNSKKMKSPGIHPVPVHQHSAMSSDNHHRRSNLDNKNKNKNNQNNNNQNDNDDDLQQQQSEEGLPPLALGEGEEMKSLPQLEAIHPNQDQKKEAEIDTNNNNSKTNNGQETARTETERERQNEDDDDENQEADESDEDPFNANDAGEHDAVEKMAERTMRNLQRNRTAARRSRIERNAAASSHHPHHLFFSTAILYERRNPCAAGAPLINYDENSMRILSVAARQSATTANAGPVNDQGEEEEEGSTNAWNNKNNNNNEASDNGYSSTVIRGGRRN